MAEDNSSVHQSRSLSDPVETPICDSLSESNISRNDRNPSQKNEALIYPSRVSTSFNSMITSTGIDTQSESTLKQRLHLAEKHCLSSQKDFSSNHNSRNLLKKIFYFIRKFVSQKLRYKLKLHRNDRLLNNVRNLYCTLAMDTKAVAESIDSSSPQYLGIPKEEGGGSFNRCSCKHDEAKLALDGLRIIDAYRHRLELFQLDSHARLILLSGLLIGMTFFFVATTVFIHYFASRHERVMSADIFALVACSCTSWAFGRFSQIRGFMTSNVKLTCRDCALSPRQARKSHSKSRKHITAAAHTSSHCTTTKRLSKIYQIPASMFKRKQRTFRTVPVVQLYTEVTAEGEQPSGDYSSSFSHSVIRQLNLQLKYELAELTCCLARLTAYYKSVSFPNRDAGGKASKTVSGHSVSQGDTIMLDNILNLSMPLALHSGLIDSSDSVSFLERSGCAYGFPSQHQGHSIPLRSTSYPYSRNSIIVPVLPTIRGNYSSLSRTARSDSFTGNDSACHFLVDRMNLCVAHCLDLAEMGTCTAISRIAARAECWPVNKSATIFAESSLADCNTNVCVSENVPEQFITDFYTLRKVVARLEAAAAPEHFSYTLSRQFLSDDDYEGYLILVASPTKGVSLSDIITHSVLSILRALLALCGGIIDVEETAHPHIYIRVPLVAVTGQHSAKPTLCQPSPLSGGDLIPLPSTNTSWTSRGTVSSHSTTVVSGDMRLRAVGAAATHGLTFVIFEPRVEIRESLCEALWRNNHAVLNIDGSLDMLHVLLISSPTLSTRSSLNSSSTGHLYPVEQVTPTPPVFAFIINADSERGLEILSFLNRNEGTFAHAVAISSECAGGRSTRSLADMRNPKGTLSRVQRDMPILATDAIVLPALAVHQAEFIDGLILLTVKVARLRIAQAEAEEQHRTFQQHRGAPWRRGDFIGSGSYGSVCKAYDTITGARMAVKEIELPQNRLEQERLLRTLYYEVTLMCELDHPNIVHYFYCERGPHTLILFLELCEEGSLADVLDARSNARAALSKGLKYGTLRTLVSIDEAQALTRQIVAALAYLHANGVAHRDLKPQNLLLKRRIPDCKPHPNVEDEPTVPVPFLAEMQVKLTDFGTAARVTKRQGGLTETEGTIRYIAPEVFAGEQYGLECDIWSLAILVLDMLGIPIPFLDGKDFFSINAFYQTMTAETPLNIDLLDLPADIRDFIIVCLCCDQNKRARAETLVTHPFLRDKALYDTATHE